MFRLPLTKLFRVDGRSERTPGREIGKQHGLLWREHRRCFRHEVNAAEDDDVGFGLGGFAAQAQRVANEIGDILNLGPFVVVGDDHRVARARQVLDLLLQLRVQLGCRVYHSMCLPLHLRFARGKSLL